MKHIRKALVWLLFLSILLGTLPIIPFDAKADGAYEYAWFPAPQLYVTQLAYESYSHGSQNALDIAPGGTVFAPFTGKIVYVDSNWGYAVLQSTNKVYYADGTLDYMTVGFMHDENISDLYVGKIIAQGTGFYHAGGMGDGNPNAYGDHVHITVHRGRVTRGYPYGTGDVYAYKALHINSAKTKSIINPGRMASGNHMNNGAPSNWSGLWVNLSDAKLTITFNANGGICSTATKSVSRGSTAGALPTPSRSGYDFVGWFTSVTGGTRVTESTTISSSITVYARWASSVKQVTLYDAAGAIWKSGSYSANANYTLPDSYPSKAGSYFSGWVYQENSNVFDVRPGDTITVQEDVNLYPLYITHEEAVSGKPILMYNPNDFSVPGYEVQEEIIPVVRQIDSSYWTDWSEYNPQKVDASSAVQVRTTPLFRYYYFLCPGCGDHNPLQGKCGCGASSTSSHWRVKWSTTRYTDSNSSVVSYSTNKRVTTSLGDGQMWYFSSGNLSDTSIGTKDTDSSSSVIVTGYSSRNYIQQTDSRTDYIPAYCFIQTGPITVSKIEVVGYPIKTVYRIGEAFDPAGIVIIVTYSDGSVNDFVTEGFTVSGFDSSTAGPKRVTVEYMGKTDEISVQVIIPYVSITGHPNSKTVEVGKNAQFGVIASGTGLTYQWQYRFGSGAWTNTSLSGNKTSLLTVPATAARNGCQYRCVVRDYAGNVAYSNAATLTVKQPLKITGHPGSKTVEAGKNAQFGVIASGTGLTYQWQYRFGNGAWTNTTLSGNKSSLLTVPVTAARNGCQYRCVVRDSAGNVAYSNPATLTVKTPLKITGHPLSKSVTVNTNAKFGVIASGAGLTYQWQYRFGRGAWTNTTLSGNKTSLLTVPATSARNGCQYRCVVRDSAGNVAYSNPATLTVKTSLKITGHPLSKSVTVNTNAKFGVIASGAGLTYQWQYRFGRGAWTNTTLSGNKTSLLTVPATSARNGCQYRCVVRDSAGNVAYSNPATLTVK